MEINLTEDQLKEVVLAALLDYEAVKKTRRFKAVKKTLQGTMVATLIGSTGVIAANNVRKNQVTESTAIMAPATKVVSMNTKFSANITDPEFIPAVAHFGLNRYALAESQQERLKILIRQLPKDSEITIIGLTDKSGSQSQNKRIGKLRARAVAEFMSMHGLKIKGITSKVSDDMPESWMQRRVDIIVESHSEPFFLNLTSPEKPSVYEKSQAKFQPKLAPPVTHVEKTDKQSSNLKNNGVDNIIVNNKSINAEPMTKQRQRVQGVVHFPLNRYELATAHIERLKELIAKLPKDSEIIVVGRTESNGSENTIDKLGALRAKSVANFLAGNGVKVVAVGSKNSRDGFTGWGARSVDIIVESSPTPNKIKLQSPFKTN